MYWGLDPVGGTGDSYGVTPPAPAPTVGKVQEVWQTALYSATQAAALQPSPIRWPEIWGCAPSDHSSGLSPDCEMNGRCVDGACVCAPGWRGPRCSALKLGPTPRHSGFRHSTSSSWGGSIVKDAAEEKWHMFSSFILGECGLDDWNVNSEIVRAVSPSPLGPYTMAERVAGPFAHEPNLAQGRLPGGELVLLGTMNQHKQPPPEGIINCSRATGGEKLRVTEAGVMPPPKDTYAWVAKTPQGMAAAEPMLVLNSTRYDNDPNVHHTNRTAVCDTNLAGAILPNGSLVGVWRHCETVNLHTVPHSLLAVDAKDPLTYAPSDEVNCAHTPILGSESRPDRKLLAVPFVTHAGAEDPYVYMQGDVVHAVLHDEQITRCADSPVGCWPGGRHAFSLDDGRTFTYSPFDAWSKTVPLSLSCFPSR